MRVESDFRRATHRLDRKERDNYSSMLWNAMRLERKPKVAIRDVVGPTLDNAVDYVHEGPLKETMDYYSRKSDPRELIQVLRFYCAYLMPQARREPVPEKQLFLLFKVVDFARTIVQHSSFAVNRDAETLVWGIFYDMGMQRPQVFGRYMDTERAIYNMMKRLQVAPLDHATRLQLAEQMNRQTSYFDALVQYQYLLERFPHVHREDDVRRGRVYILIGDIFQGLSQYAEGGPIRYTDARKMRNFIERYNRSYARRGRGLPPIGGQESQLKRTERALRAIANEWYLRAMPVRAVGAKPITEAVFRVGANHMKDGQAKEALKILREGYPYWLRVPESAEFLPHRIEYLSLIVAAAVRSKQRGAADWANREMRDHESKLREFQDYRNRVDNLRDSSQPEEEVEM
ncbi:MAG: hypothetical protein IIA14_04020 [SAR324 cluster bacterium]|nr:hypothetical protein [SAR324 cluster bacterium]